MCLCLLNPLLAPASPLSPLTRAVPEPRQMVSFPPPALQAWPLVLRCWGVIFILFFFLRKETIVHLMRWL